MSNKLLITIIFCAVTLFILRPAYAQQNLFQVTHETEGVSDFVWSPNGNQFAYIALNNDTSRLYLINVDGNNKTLLTSTEAYGYIDWKGAVITFGSRVGPDYYDGLIKRIAPDGSNETTIIGPYWYHFGFLRADGNWLLYSEAPNGWWRANRCDINGNNNLIVSHNTLVQQVGWLGRDHIIYSRGPNYYTTCGIHRVNFDGSGHIQLTPETLPNNALFIASPDTSKIVYCDGSADSWDLWIMDTDGNNKTQLTTDPTHDYLSNNRDNIWSADSHSFYFVSERSGNGDIYKLNIDGSGLIPVTDHDSLDYIPVPSPDGKKLAFISKRDGVNNIWIIRGPQILSCYPIQNQLNVSVDENISVTFDIDVNEATINNNTFIANGSISGLHQGAMSYDNIMKTATFDPDNDFEIGEVVTVVLTTDIQSMTGISLDSSYTWSFTTDVNTGTGIFFRDSLYHFGDSPHGVYAADFDNDGDLDLATANYGTDNITILSNNGDATFTYDSAYTVIDPWRVIAADLNTDGNMDLVSANSFAGQLSVLLNNGDGTFASQTAYSVGNSPSSVIAADLDGDGDLDLANTNGLSDNMAVLFNDGSGNFVIDSLYAVGSTPRSVYAADLNGNGFLDLTIAAGGSNNVWIFLNNGDGTFNPDSTYFIGDEMRSCFAADVDGDTDIDVVTANLWNGSISVLPNQGDGIFGAPTTFITGGSQPISVLAADLDGDGDLDVATANANSDDVSIMLNNGDGTYVSFSSCPAGNQAFSIFAADLDSDGDLDLTTANAWSNDISVIINSNIPQITSILPAQNSLNIPANTDISVTFNLEMDPGSLNDSTFIVYARSSGTHQGTISYDNQTRTAIFDPINDFSAGEVVTTILTSGIVSTHGVTLDQNHTRSFIIEATDGPAVFISDSTYLVGANPLSIFAADLNSDGNLDLATANEGSNSLSILYNDGNGSFGTQSLFTVGSVPKSVYATDLDNDGDIDLITANAASSNISLLYNNGANNFAVDSVDVRGLHPNSIFAADFNKDGYTDLATANTGTDNVSVLLNNGDGTFLTDSLYSVGDNPWSIFAADFDNDGDFDITTTNNLAKNLSVLLNNGNGTFFPDSIYAVYNSLSVIAADFNGDNYVDLVTVNSDSNNVSILLNMGDGTFGNQSNYPVGIFPISIFTADFDGDGDLDLATSNLVSYDISILLNNGDATFSSQTKYQANDPYGLFSADIDADGDLDIAVTNWGINRVTVLMNREFTDLETLQNQIPNQFALHQNYPNPFNPVTKIKYDLPYREKVTLKIYDVLGREVKILIDDLQEPGYQSVQFDASNLASGIYYYQLKAGQFVSTRKLLLIK